MKGISTIVATILMLMITIGLASAAYVFVNQAVVSKQRFLTEIPGGTFCSGGTLSFTIKNEGPDTIRAIEQTRVSVDEACTTDFNPADIPSGSTVVYSSTGCTSGRAHSYRLTGPANAVAITASCA